MPEYVVIIHLLIVIKLLTLQWLFRIFLAKIQ